MHKMMMALQENSIIQTLKNKICRYSQRKCIIEERH